MTCTGFFSAPPPDQHNNIDWGCPALDIPGATSLNIGSGKSNTDSILANCYFPIDLPAAYYCDTITLSGYYHWFLPSYLELKEIQNKLMQKDMGTMHKNITGVQHKLLAIRH